MGRYRSVVKKVWTLATASNFINRLVGIVRTRIFPWKRSDMAGDPLKKGRYTEYSNKIGLFDKSNKQFIGNSPEVVLSFPFKDAVLEAGMTKEDAGREERFLNIKIDAKDIDTLEDPKVLTNFKYIDKDGEKELDENSNIKFFDENGELKQNLLIKGNNLLALHTLKERLAGRVKLIYIDPPYNTGNDGFGYNDTFTYSSWLVFMKNRLEIARELLSEDGLIFISIDSSRENANGRVGTPLFPYLFVLLDEIFGRKNFIAQLTWKKKKQPSFLSRVAGITEPILVYAKNEKNIGKLQLGQQTDTTKRIDNASNNYSVMEIPSGIRYMGQENTVIRKGVYQNKTMTTEFLDDVIVENGRTTNPFRARAKYRNGQSEIAKFCEQDLLFITANNSFRRDKTSEELTAGKTITDLLLDWGQNQDATEHLRQVFEIKDNEKVFENSKPELLIGNIIEVATRPNDIVLDFFIGSGTTATAAMKKGRRWIGVEQMDYMETVTKKRLQKVIDGEKGGISELENWNGGGSFVYCELKKYNQDFIDRIMEAITIPELEEIYEDMQKNAFLKFFFDKNEFEKDENFRSKNLDERKQLLVDILDENQFYLNLSEMNDTKYKVTNAERVLTERFYQIKEDEVEDDEE